MRPGTRGRASTSGAAASRARTSVMPSSVSLACGRLVILSAADRQVGELGAGDHGELEPSLVVDDVADRVAERAQRELSRLAPGQATGGAHQATCVQWAPSHSQVSLESSAVGSKSNVMSSSEKSSATGVG